jgi:type I restriction enzyme S subunit
LSERRATTVDQLGRIITGKTPSSALVDAFGGEIPFVTPSDMDGRRIINTTARSLSNAGAEAVKGAQVPANSIMVSCIGSDMGKAAIAGRDCVTNQQINSIIVETDDSPFYVYYDLSTRKDEIRGAASGSAQPILNKAAFGRLEIALPQPREQRAIAHILGTLDDKIEVNRRMNETLEAIARTIFKCWFVDFDPVRAKASNEPTESICRRLGLPSDLLSLFPDRFKDPELGEIPEGWEVRSLNDCADYINGLAFRNEHFSQDRLGLPVIKIGELKDGVTEQTKFTEALLDTKYRITSGDILFSWSGSPDTSIDTFVWVGSDGWLNQHIFKIAFKREVEKYFVYYLLRHLKPEFVEIARNKQTTGLGHVTVQDLKRLKVVFPQDNVLRGFNLLAEPLFQKSYSNDCESSTLTTLRDTLLPKLLFGELRVPAGAV